ncbi:MAG: 8-oxo-dGTP diphosphatase [Candidatus Heimdallarchaeota archaeon]|nr:MAG: 8-oxo-dGTP diphosphatase [Candidatus Heimdallarchaeota archaeon]
MVHHKLATLAYIVHKNEVLLLFRNKKENDFHEGKYIGIGGRLEPGETPLECILRELKEETGYALTPEEIEFRGYIYFDEIHRDKLNEDLPAFNWLVFLYYVPATKKLDFENPEGKLLWVPISEIPYEKMWDGDRIFTPKLLETHEIIEAKFMYDGEKIFNWSFGREN